MLKCYYQRNPNRALGLCLDGYCRTLASGARRRGDPRLISGSFVFVNKGVAT
jgi:hypothetical protein